jgi:hypothetical protein
VTTSQDRTGVTTSHCTMDNSNKQKTNENDNNTSDTEKDHSLEEQHMRYTKTLSGIIMYCIQCIYIKNNPSMLNTYCSVVEHWSGLSRLCIWIPFCILWMLDSLKTSTNFHHHYLPHQWHHCFSLVDAITSWKCLINNTNDKIFTIQPQYQWLMFLQI